MSKTSPDPDSRLLRLVVAGALVVVLAALLWVDAPWSPLGPSARDVPPTILGDFSDAEIARIWAYHGSVDWAAYISYGTGILVAALLGLSPLGARIVRALGPRWWVSAALGGLLLLLVVRLVALPFDVWIESVRRRFGLSTQGWGGWLTDQALGFGVSAVVTVVALVGLVALARVWRRRWWIPAAGLAAGFVVLGTYVWPLLVEPLFNRFTPMQAGSLKTSLLRLAAEDGVPVSDVLVADASRRTTTLNAYVSGLGGSRRLVVYDTLLSSASRQEVRSVVAHELGHEASNDVLKGTVVTALGTGAGVVVLSMLLDVAWIRRRAGVDSAADPRAVAVVLALTMVGGAIAMPAANAYSRQVEARADVHALDITEDPEGFAATQRRIAVANLSALDPPVLAYAWFASHPTAPQRIALTRSWQLLRGAEPLGPLSHHPPG